jgi:hypothetical protein
MAHGAQNNKQKKALHLVSGNANDNGLRCYLTYIMPTPMGISFLKHSLMNFIVSYQNWKVSTWYHWK